MRDDISDIAASYDHSVGDEDARLVFHQLEYDLTWCYLRETAGGCSIPAITTPKNNEEEQAMRETSWKVGGGENK